jgi:hypothetical protein
MINKVPRYFVDTKEIYTMKAHNFLELHSNITKSKAGNSRNALDMATNLRNKAKASDYLVWVSEFAKIDGNAQSIKDAQNCINKTPCQKMIFGLEPRDKLTQKLRMKRGNAKLRDAGLCTQADIDSKAYMYIVTDIAPPVVVTAKEKLQKLQLEFSLTLKQLSKLVSQIEYSDEIKH